ncbi:MAG: LD-carboxypeptidase [Planctomycetota bacterium]
MSDEHLAVPPALRPGDGISIVAPASSPERKTFDAAIANLQRAGYRPKTYRDVCTPRGYLSGTDSERAEELNEAFADPDTSMVLAARGGYGCGRILDKIDFDLLKRRPKIVCGYSDLTALHAAIHRRCGLVSFHGPNLVAGLGDDAAETVDERHATFAMFRGGPNEILLTAGDTLSDGVAEGRLAGGNAAVLLSVLGTPYEPDLSGAILVLEDVGEAPYRIDRLLTQLRLSGVFDRLAGLVLGYFTEATLTDGPTVEQVAAEFLEPLNVPVVAGAPFGHEHPNMPLPLGARVRLDADRRMLETLQPVVSQ